MIFCNPYLRKQLSQAYENAKKVISTPDIEKEYIRKAKAGSQAAKDTLFNLYIPVVISYSRSSSYEMYTGDMGDLISSAALGFNRALELFDTSLGYEFGCYYKWHIKNAMNKELYGDSLVAVPENLQKPAKDANGKPLLDDDGRPARLNPVTIVSGDTAVGDDDSRTTLMETFASNASNGYEDAEEKDRERLVGELLSALPKIECEAIRKMVMDDNHMSSREWGDSHGRSHEWARKVKNRAMKRLREKMSEMYIEDRLAV
jgi:RNA polymerase sigma factor (sigma-70 family)